MRITPYDGDDSLIEAAKGDGVRRMRFSRTSDVVVVLGRGSDLETELHVEAVEKDGVPVFRRRGGGCSVVLDPGNVILSVALPLPGVGGIRGAFSKISSWLIEGLARVGVGGVVREGVSDLALGGRKIGGSCIYRTLGLLYYSTTLLVDPDLNHVHRYLAYPPREPDYRQGRPHREFMGSLGTLVGKKDVPAFLQELSSCLSLKNLNGKGKG